jgi:hypothetical protein
MRYTSRADIARPSWHVRKVPEQQGIRRGWQAHAIDTKLTLMGKDERALSVSGYHYRSLCKITDYAFNQSHHLQPPKINHFTIPSAPLSHALAAL